MTTAGMGAARARCRCGSCKRPWRWCARSLASPAPKEAWGVRSRRRTHTRLASRRWPTRLRILMRRTSGCSRTAASPATSFSTVCWPLPSLHGMPGHSNHRVLSSCNCKTAHQLRPAHDVNTSCTASPGRGNMYAQAWGAGGAQGRAWGVGPRAIWQARRPTWAASCCTAP